MAHPGEAIDPIVVAAPNQLSGQVKVYSELVARFSEFTTAATIEGAAGRAVVPNHYVAAAVVSDEEQHMPRDQMTQGIERVAQAAQFIKENPGETVLALSPRTLDVGVVSQDEPGLSFDNQSRIPSDLLEVENLNVNVVGFVPTDRRFRSEITAIPAQTIEYAFDGSAIAFPYTDAVLTPDRLDDAYKIMMASQEGQVVAVGDDAAAFFLTWLSRKEFAASPDPLELAESSVALLGIAAAKDIGASMSVKLDPKIHAVGVNVIGRKVAAELEPLCMHLDISQNPAVERRLSAFDFNAKDIGEIVTQAAAIMKDRSFESYARMTDRLPEDQTMLDVIEERTRAVLEAIGADFVQD